MFRGPLLLWLVVLVLCRGISSQCQVAMVTAYGINDGLVSNSIRCFFQDSKGIIWIGTLDGISIYDGHHFRNFSRANGLDHEIINDFFEESPGKIWASLNNGSIAEFKDYRIQRIIKSKIIINKFYRVPWGKILVVTDLNGIQEFKDGQLIKPVQPFPSSNYFSMAVVGDSVLYLGNDSAVHVLNKQYQLQKVVGFTGKYLGVNRVVGDKQGRVWANLLPRLSLISDQQVRSLPASLQIHELLDGIAADLLMDRQGRLWVPGQKGLVIIDETLNPVIIKGFSDKSAFQVECLYQDKQDNIWVGTNLGLYRYNAALLPITYQFHDPVLGNYIKGIKQVEKDKLIVGTQSGTYLLQTDNFLKKSLSPIIDDQSESGKSLQGKPVNMLRASQYFIHPTAARSILQLNFQAPLDIIYHSLADGKGAIFSSRIGKIFIFHDNKMINNDLEMKSAISGLELDKWGTIWIGTWNHGITRLTYSIEKGKLIIIKKQNFLEDIEIRSLYADPPGNIWVGTRNHGIYRIQPSLTGIIKIDHWTMTDQLSSNWIRAITSDTKGNIWAAFHYGIDKMISQQDGSFKIFPFSHFNNLYFSAHLVTIDSSERFWLATNNGLISFRDNHQDTLSPPNVMVSNLVIDDSIVIDFKNEIRLPPGQHKLKFEFSCPGFINEKQVLYKYKLEGVPGAGWSKPSSDFMVNFDKLPAGNYTFMVKAVRWGNYWSEPAFVKFSIKPRFSETPWFFLTGFIFLLAIVYFVFRQRLAAIRKEADNRQRIAEAETRALRAQMNPHFLFNSINAIDSLIQTDQADKATSYLARFSKLLRLVLEHSRKNVIPFEEDWEAMKLYLELQRFRTGNRFEFFMEVSTALLNNDVYVPSQVIQPFVENAIMHGLMNKTDEDRKLWISAGIEGNFLVYRIRDNGIGRKLAGKLNQYRDADHHSIGLEMAIERIQLHNKENKDFVIIDDLYNGDQPSGTTVTVFVNITE